MARLPNPGEDAGQWGAILNEFLTVAHDSSGALRDTYVRTVNNTAPDGNGNVTVAGGSGGTTDHGALTGLSDDDHPQYHTDVRGDARYFTQAQTTTAIAAKYTKPGNGIPSTDLTTAVQTSLTKADASVSTTTANATYVRTVNSTGPDGNGNVTISGGTTSHGALTGLGDDDHQQYLTNTRGDTRYYTKSQVDTALSTKQAAGQYIDSPTINHIVQLTAASYASITHDVSTLYVVVG